MNLEDKTGYEPKYITHPLDEERIKNSKYRPVELCRQLESLRIWRILSSRSEMPLDYAV